MLLPDHFPSFAVLYLVYQSKEINNENSCDPKWKLEQINRSQMSAQCYSCGFCLAHSDIHTFNAVFIPFFSQSPYFCSTKRRLKFTRVECIWNVRELEHAITCQLSIRCNVKQTNRRSVELNRRCVCNISSFRIQTCVVTTNLLYLVFGDMNKKKLLLSFLNYKKQWQTR